MGFNIEEFAQMKIKLQELEDRLFAIENHSDRVKEAVNFERTVPVKVIGDAIQSAYDRIESEIEALRHEPVTDIVNKRINYLIALKQEVPKHYTFTKADQEWLNDEINNILGVNSSNLG